MSESIVVNGIEIKEDFGYCKNCGARTSLADGLCIQCWDGEPRPRCPVCNTWMWKDETLPHRITYRCRNKHPRLTVYTGQRLPNTTFDTEIIARAVQCLAINLSLSIVQLILKREFNWDIPEGTIAYWRKKYIYGQLRLRSPK